MTRETAVQIDYHCITCGRDVDGCIRVQNDVQSYVKCLKCGLGVDKGGFGDKENIMQGSRKGEAMKRAILFSVALLLCLVGTAWGEAVVLGWGETTTKCYQRYEKAHPEENRYMLGKAEEWCAKNPPGKDIEVITKYDAYTLMNSGKGFTPKDCEILKDNEASLNLQSFRDYCERIGKPLKALSEKEKPKPCRWEVRTIWVLNDPVLIREGWELWHPTSTENKDLIWIRRKVCE